LTFRGTRWKQILMKEPPHNEDSRILEILAAEIIRNAPGNWRVKTLREGEAWVCPQLQIPSLHTMRELTEFLENPNNKKKCALFENPQKFDLLFLSDLLEEKGFFGPLLIPQTPQN